MSKKVLLVHGWGGSDYPHWQSWLAGEIAKDYGKVSFLQFSDFDFPDLELWKKELEQELEEFAPDIVICHSLANTLWFHLAHEKRLKKVSKLYLVAPPSLKCDVDEIKSFFPLTPPKDIYAQDAILVCSTNDPYLDITEAKELQKTLGIEMLLLENAGHINTDSGHGKWPWILEDLKNTI